MADRKENEMPTTNSVASLRGLDSNGNSVLIAPSSLPYPNTGGICISGRMSYGKWYRIAVGLPGSEPSSGIFNLVNSYGNEAPGGILFYVFASGYTNEPIITKIASSNYAPISKARVVFASSISLLSCLDVWVRTYLSNPMHISASSLFGFRVQSPEEVSEAVPDGYSVKEFSF